MKIRKKSCFALLSAIMIVEAMCIYGSSYLYRRYQQHKKREYILDHFGYPNRTDVKIDSTNLPIVFINTQNQRIDRYDEITARMVIVDNGLEQYNYSDTIAHPAQNFDFDGYISIRYRGNSSYSESDKKPYAIRVLDKPLKDGGEKKRCSLLGMRKGKKWAMIAPYTDRSMIRDALTYELARPYFEFVPEGRFCELILNGVYYGIHWLAEQPDARRMGVKKSKSNADMLAGGYMLQLDFKDTVGAYKSKYWSNVFYRYMYPDSSKLTAQQRIYINSQIDDLENDFSKGILRGIDTLSMVDFQLATEFAHNDDSYIKSTFLYKTSNSQPFQFTLWDFNLAYGNFCKGNKYRTDTWVYPTRENEKKFWWSIMMEHPDYVICVQNRWKQYRNENYSNEHICVVIDSLTSLLTSGNAFTRDSMAWYKQWGDNWLGPVQTRPQKYVSSSYADEIDYMKRWINARLEWMDRKLWRK